MRGITVSELRSTLTVSDVVAGTSGRVAGGETGRPIAGVSIDTRTLKPGQMFVAIAGPNFDGHDFVAQAVERGAAAVMVHRDVPAPPGVPVVRVGDTTQALKDLGRHVRMQAAIPVAAVTGSAGKTTTK